MRRRTILPIAALLLMALTLWGVGGCLGQTVTGSGNLTTETHDFSDFSRIEAHSGFELEVTRADTFSIEITADNNVQQFIIVEKSGDTLDIRLQGTPFYHSVTLRATVTMPELHYLELTGGSEAAITGFRSEHDFEANLSGGSQLSGDIISANAEFELNGGSQVFLEGAGEDLTIDASGGSQLDLEDFPIDDAAISMSGGSQATINISGTLDAYISGGSQIFYVGTPTLGDTECSGGSGINHK
jgi:hypothetical protein